MSEIECVNDLIKILEEYRDNGWGESRVRVLESTQEYLKIKHIQGFCGTVLILK